MSGVRARSGSQPVDLRSLSLPAIKSHSYVEFGFGLRRAQTFSDVAVHAANELKGIDGGLAVRGQRQFSHVGTENDLAHSNRPGFLASPAWLSPSRSGNPRNSCSRR